MSRYAIIDTRMSEKCKKSLECLDLQLIEVPLNPNLDYPISAHPDIFMFVHEKNIIMEESVYNYLEKHLFDFGNKGYAIQKGRTFLPKTEYPYDCAYNFAVCGNHLIGNMCCAAPELKSYADENGMDIINVKQGYSKCNICVVSDNAIITEDSGISKECRKYGIDVLLLKTKSIKLNGYDNGFIGGATGVLDYTNSKSKKILFAGNVQNHPEYCDINLFCNKYGAELVSMSDEDLYDYGSIIVI